MQSITKLLMAILAMLLLSTQFGNGCVSDGGDDDYYDDRPGSGGGSGGSGGGWSGGGQNIPSRAAIVAEGKGTLRYRAEDDGRVYLFDADRRVVIDDRNLNRGREYIISPTDGKIWIDDNRLRTYEFNRGNEHRIYFLADRGSGSGGGGGRPPALPSELRDADRVAYGRGDLSHIARHGGKVWVYDATDGQIVYRSDVRRDDRLSVSPERNRITLREANSRSSFRLNPRNDYAIYFQRDDRVNDDGGRNDFDTSGGTVPKSAVIAREGRGEDLSFEATGTGTVYVYDADNRKVVTTYRVKRGQRFTVSPSRGEGAVDGKTVFRKSLSNKVTYKLYFNLDV
jgi:hypothetical protein